MKSVIATFALVGALTLQPAAAAPALWEARDDDSVIWLFGSISALPEDLKWRTPLFDSVQAKAGKIALAADFGAEATTAAGAESMARGIYTDGTLLTDRLDDETEQQLRGAADAVGIPSGIAVTMRPWFAARALYIGTQVAYGLGYYSLESQLQPTLPADRLVFLDLDTDSMQLMDDVSEDEQLDMLTSTLQQLGSIPTIAVRLTSNWAAGTPEDVEQAFVMESSGFSAAIVERVVKPGNLRLATKIEAMLVDNQENLIVLDTANLIGDGGVLDLLEKAGYAIERVQ